MEKVKFSGYEIALLKVCCREIDAISCKIKHLYIEDEWVDIERKFIINELQSVSEMLDSLYSTDENSLDDKEV